MFTSIHSIHSKLLSFTLYYFYSNYSTSVYFIPLTFTHIYFYSFYPTFIQFIRLLFTLFHFCLLHFPSIHSCSLSFTTSYFYSQIRSLVFFTPFAFHSLMFTFILSILLFGMPWRGINKCIHSCSLPFTLNYFHSL